MIWQWLICSLLLKKHSRTFHICKVTYCKSHTTLTILYKVVLFELTDQVTECHSLTVLSPSRAPDAMMFSDGWHAVHSTTSAWKIRIQSACITVPQCSAFCLSHATIYKQYCITILQRITANFDSNCTLWNVVNNCTITYESTTNQVAS